MRVHRPSGLDQAVSEPLVQAHACSVWMQRQRRVDRSKSHQTQRCVWQDPDASFLQQITPPAEDKMAFWLLIGLPGSGKSTLAQQWVQLGDRRIISTDQIRAQLFGDAAIQGPWLQVWREVRQQLEQAAEQVRSGQLQTVLLDATHTTRKQRRQAIALARKCGFSHMTGLWLDVPLATCLQRNQQRSRQVPTEIITEMHRRFLGALPSLQEDFDRLIIVTLPEPNFQRSEIPPH